MGKLLCNGHTRLLNVEVVWYSTVIPPASVMRRLKYHRKYVKYLETIYNAVHRLLAVEVEAFKIHRWVSCWLRSTVGQTSVFSRWTDPVLHSTFSWRVTTMWVNRPLKISQLGQLGLSSFWVDKWVVSAIRCSPPQSVEAPSGERLRGKRQAWCLLQLKLCDLCLSALKWFVYHARRYTSARLYLYRIR